MGADRSRSGRATVAAAGLAGLAALFVAVVAEGPLRPVERVFLLFGVGLLGVGVTVGSRLARTPRPRLMDGRFEGDDDGHAAVDRHGRFEGDDDRGAAAEEDGREDSDDHEPVLRDPIEEAR